MKIGLYAYDIGPWRVMEMLAEGARKRVREVDLFTGQQDGYVVAYSREMFDCDVVAVGLSSFKTEEELDLVERLFARDIPVVVIEDYPGVSQRPKAKAFASRFAGVIIAHPSVKRETYKFGYRNVIYAGPPPHWWKMYHDMKSVRESMRKTDGIHTVPLYSNDTIFAIPGVKTPEIVNALLRAVIEIEENLENHLVIAFRQHPGERPDPKKGEEEQTHYVRIWKERDEMLAGRWFVHMGDSSVFEKGKATSQMIASADLTLFTGGSTDAIIAPYRRLNGAYLWTPKVGENLKQQGIASGRHFAAELGGLHLAEGVEDLVSTIKFAMSETGKQKLRASQEENFPLPEIWDTTPEYIKVLEQIARPCFATRCLRGTP